MWVNFLYKCFFVDGEGVALCVDVRYAKERVYDAIQWNKKK